MIPIMRWIPTLAQVEMHGDRWIELSWNHMWRERWAVTSNLQRFVCALVTVILCNATCSAYSRKTYGCLIDHICSVDKLHCITPMLRITMANFCIHEESRPVSSELSYFQAETESKFLFDLDSNFHCADVILLVYRSGITRQACWLLSPKWESRLYTAYRVRCPGHIDVFRSTQLVGPTQ